MPIFEFDEFENLDHPDTEKGFIIIGVTAQLDSSHRKPDWQSQVVLACR